MKGFFTGLLVFVIYAFLCVSILSYIFTNKSVADFFTSSSTDNQILEEDSIDSISFENSTPETFLEPDDTSREELEIDNGSLNSLETPQVQIDNSNVIEDNKPLNDLNSIPSPFNITLPDGTALIQCNAFAQVFEGQSRVKIPYACREYGISIKSFLEKNPKTSLKITGLSAPSEDINLGKQRAEYLKKLLTNTGIGDNRIVTMSSTNNLNFNSGGANGGILMEINGAVGGQSINTVADNSNLIETAPKSSSAILDSKKFTSGFQGNYFYGDQKFTSYTSTIKDLLSKNAGSKVYAYSYTAQDGDSKDNFAISRDNASTVRKIFLQSGIPTGKIQSVARGEQSSGTSGANRCIIIVIK